MDFELLGPRLKPERYRCVRPFLIDAARFIAAMLHGHDYVRNGWGADLETSPGSGHALAMNLRAQPDALTDLSQSVRDQIEAFVVPGVQPGQLGEPLPPEWFIRQLDEMRAALVEPYRAVIDGDGRFPGSVARPVPREVTIVAEDYEVLLAYDPDPDGEFALIFKTAAGFALSPIRGTSVDCFMSR